MTKVISVTLKNNTPTNLTLPEVLIIMKVLEKIDMNFLIFDNNSAYLSLSHSYEPIPGTNDPESINLTPEEYMSLRIAMEKIKRTIHQNNLEQLQIKP